ncbi:MAG: serine protease [Acetobacterium sp.]
MRPESISEKMMYNTVRLLASDGSCGTGSYFNFTIGEHTVPVIVTNKHVINDNPNETTTFLLHTADDNGDPEGNQEITFNTNWIFHENKDICYCYINPLFEEIKKRFGKNVFYVANDESIIPTQEQLQDLSALEELVMVGYPIGLWDSRNNLPIFRKGYTACHPAIDFNEDGIGLVDMACFPGSSGSPIYLFNEGGYKDKRGNTYLGRSRLFLIGYLFAGPQYTAAGALIVQSIPTQQRFSTNTPIMVNLGYYLKSSEILEFSSKVKSDLQ